MSYDLAFGPRNPRWRPPVLNGAPLPSGYAADDLDVLIPDDWNAGRYRAKLASQREAFESRRPRSPEEKREQSRERARRERARIYERNAKRDAKALAAEQAAALRRRHAELRARQLEFGEWSCGKGHTFNGWHRRSDYICPLCMQVDVTPEQLDTIVSEMQSQSPSARWLAELSAKRDRRVLAWYE